MIHYISYLPVHDSDFGWEFLQTVEQVAVALAANEARHALHGNGTSFPRLSTQNLIKKHKWMLQVADETGQIGKEGIDVRVFWVPTREGMDFGFIYRTMLVRDEIAVEVCNVFSPVELSGEWMQPEDIQFY